VRSPYMPPFVGNEDEKAALAAYIVEGLHGKEQQAVVDFEPPQLEPQALAWDEESEYLLLAWSSKGMNTFSDAGRFFSLLPPGNDVYAQLLRRGPLPEFVTEGVTLTYSLPEGFREPAKHMRFWEFLSDTFHKRLEENTGLTGSKPQGSMSLDEELRAWVASMAPVAPYAEDGSVLPYPLLHVQAKDAETGELLAETQIVAPASTEMGCKNCHGGDWRMPTNAPVMGFTDETAWDILAMHDKRSGTKLLQQAQWRRPKPCQECHSDAGMTQVRGEKDLLSLSASIHGFHAPYLQGLGADACNACHAGSANGATRMLRGVHNDMMLVCTDCHGEMADHSLALLKAEQEAGKAAATPLMQGISPNAVAEVAEIKPRQAWIQQPDCLSCHVLEEAGGEVQRMSAFNLWTEPGKENLFRMRRDYQGAMMCTACHNSPHAVYPATNPYGQDRDVLQPMRYADSPRAIGSGQNCVPCHTMDMGFFPHHPSTQ